MDILLLAMIISMYVTILTWQVTPWLGQPGFRFPGSMTLCLGMSRAHPRCHGCTVTSKGRIKPTCIDRDTPTMHHHAHSGENAPPAPSRDARGSCRRNCADTCKQQSNGLTHHI